MMFEQVSKGELTRTLALSHFECVMRTGALPIHLRVSLYRHPKLKAA